MLTAPQSSHCIRYGMILQPQGQCSSPCWEIGLFQNIPELSSSLPISTGDLLFRGPLELETQDWVGSAC